MKINFQNKKVILFGLGKKGKNITTYILEHCNNVLYIIDNNKNMHGKTINGCKVYPAEKLLDENKKNTVVVITTYGFHKEMTEQLERLNWGDNYIIAINDIEFFKSYEFEYWRKVDVLTENNKEILYPTYLHIELSGICNCKCTYCPFHGEANIKQGNKKLMTWDILKQLTAQAKGISSLKTLDTAGAGEIFVNPEWFEMLGYILKETGIRNIIAYTNGMLLNRENVDKLFGLDCDSLQLEISIDGRTPEENDYYRIGSKYSVIKSNIEYAYESMQTHIKLLITNCYPLSIEYVENCNFKISPTAPVPEFIKADFPNIKSLSKCTYSLTPQYPLGQKLKSVEVSYPQGLQTYRCFNIFNRLAVNCTGDILKCSCGAAGIEAIGNIMNTNMLDCWQNNQELIKARDLIKNKSESPEFCKYCARKPKGNFYIAVTDL